MKISMGNDHAGTQYKNLIKLYLEDEAGIDVKNYGTNDDNSVDYADFVHPVAEDVEHGEADYGIIICGSGNGASMTANKHQKIRCALCWTGEITKLSRSHNNANILSIPARFVSVQQAVDMVKIFLNTEFDGGRHQERIDKIPCE